MNFFFAFYSWRIRFKMHLSGKRRSRYSGKKILHWEVKSAWFRSGIINYIKITYWWHIFETSIQQYILGQLFSLASTCKVLQKQMLHCLYWQYACCLQLQCWAVFFGLKRYQLFWTGRYNVIWTAIGMISSSLMDIILSGPMDINVPTCLHKHQSMTLRRQFAPLFLFFFGIFVVLLLPVFLGILLLGILLLLLLLLLTISRFRVLQRRGAAWTCIKT